MYNADLAAAKNKEIKKQAEQQKLKVSIKAVNVSYKWYINYIFLINYGPNVPNCKPLY